MSWTFAFDSSSFLEGACSTVVSFPLFCSLDEFINAAAPIWIFYAARHRYSLCYILLHLILPSQSKDEVSETFVLIVDAGDDPLCYILLMQSKSMVIGSITGAVTQLKQAAKPISFSDIQVGAVYEGRIEIICQYGVFVDIGNVTVLVYKTCLLNPGEFPLDFYIPGNRIVIRITETDGVKGRIPGEEYHP